MTKKQYKYGKKYNRNLITGKIRRLLDKNPEAGYAELEEMFGKVTRSIIVTFYDVYKDMYNRSGHLKRLKKYKARPDTIRAKTQEYFAEHPDHTIQQASDALGMSWIKIHNAIYGLQVIGHPVSYHRVDNERRERGKALQIRAYFKTHPDATSRECAEAIGVKTSYVSLIRYRDRRQKCVSV